jgi:hypothetical protein
MPYYNLLIVKEQRYVPAIAKDRQDALFTIGKQIGVQLTLEGEGVADFLLGESETMPDWMYHTIPVFAA